ncbi:methyltransferase domain-containing protein [Fragilaria crotonensis]|nr:methyltransferase domain-containing protein [Fragilaria crotonensis]
MSKCKENDKVSVNELSTVVSYAILFQSLSATELKKSSSKCYSSDSFWQNDEWTAADVCQAEILLKQNEPKCAVTPHRVQFYEKEAAKSWDTFYQHHGTKFFNDRHYLSKAFPEEFGDASSSSGTASKCLVEIGCGVGNNILPLLEHNPTWKVWGYDLSKVAVTLMQQDARFDSNRATAGVWDIASSDPAPISAVADVCTLLFCLSAISPEKMKTAASNVATTLRPGGVLVLRDYGRFDEAQLKLGVQRAKRLGENFYVKSDGTRCFYFALEDLEALFVTHAGLEVLELTHIRRKYQNRANGEHRRRVWVQGRFRKPFSVGDAK